jgi:hypothetical protein
MDHQCGFSATVAEKVQVNFWQVAEENFACLFIGGIRHEIQVLRQDIRNYKYSYL